MGPVSDYESANVNDATPRVQPTAVGKGLHRGGSVRLHRARLSSLHNIPYQTLYIRDVS
jgi:hypothetical protein